MGERRRRIAILGAGPVGLEAALQARALGLEVSVFERGRVAENVRRWGFVRLFSPWSLNVSSLGLETLRGLGLPPPSPDAFPTGHELREKYLDPLAESLGDLISTRTEVLAISRSGLLKGDLPGGKQRGSAPFRLLLRDPSGERDAEADVVIDAGGVYATPASLGDGGVPALGEIAMEENIEHPLPDIRGSERARFAGRSTLLVGAGFSAATTLSSLLDLVKEAPATTVVWARRGTRAAPFPLHAEDPLPERARLAIEGNRVAAAPPDGITVLEGVTVHRLERDEEKIRVELTPIHGNGEARIILVDRIVAHVGHRPDTSVFRELQVHQCYASEGPMALAAALLRSAGGAGGDCLAQKNPGGDTLRNPEPGFFVIGQKSYGRRSDFLLRVGLEQVRDVFRLIESSLALDSQGACQRG